MLLENTFVLDKNAELSHTYRGQTDSEIIQGISKTKSVCFVVRVCLLA